MATLDNAIVILVMSILLVAEALQVLFGGTLRMSMVKLMLKDSGSLRINQH
jgi:hypothetical protein